MSQKQGKYYLYNLARILLKHHKRRCIHDEFGNEDPTKLAEASLPRPAAKRKKAPLTSPETPPRKKTKRLSAHLENTSVPVVVAEELATSGARDASARDGFEQEETLVQSNGLTEEKSIAVPVDPMLLKEPPVSHAPAHPPVFNPEDQVNLIATSPLSDVKCEQLGDDLHNVPALASLVSPPESTHNDAESTPPITTKLKSFTPPTTSASSRQSSHPARQQAARYTPESGPARRPSSSSGGAFTRESNSPTVSIVPSVDSHKKDKSRTASTIDADEQSLKLIRELQAQDLGLRRRGRS